MVTTFWKTSEVSLYTQISTATQFIPRKIQKQKHSWLQPDGVTCRTYNVDKMFTGKLILRRKNIPRSNTDVICIMRPEKGTHFFFFASHYYNHINICFINKIIKSLDHIGNALEFQELIT